MSEKKKIKSRKVFYFEGFDPRGVRYYHNLYRDEAAKQAEVHGADIEIGRRKKSSKHVTNWNIKHKEDGVVTNTEYSFLHWDDVVRYNWVKNPFILTIYAMLFYLSATVTLAIFKIFYFARGVATVILIPLIFIILCGIVSYYSAEFIYKYHSSYLLFIASFMLVYYFVTRLNRIMNIFWLLRIYIFCAQYGFRENFLINTRITEFQKRVVKALNDDKYDEVLLVGHSVGVLFLVSTLSNIVKSNPKLKHKMKVLSLGHCLQLVSMAPWSAKFREELKILSTSEDVYWLDVSSKVDGACIPLTSPYFKLVDDKDVKNKVKLIPAGFHKMFGDKEYKRLKRNKFRIHFQYLMAGKIKTEYDYFDLTSGGKNFIEHFK